MELNDFKSFCEMCESCIYHDKREKCDECMSTTCNGLRPALFEARSILAARPVQQCECVVKKTEVKGMCLIFPRRGCPVHGHLQ